MAITSAAANSIASLYIGFYDRAPDPVGLDYWIGRLADGVSLTDIAESFAASPEAASTYPYIAQPNLFTPEQMIDQVYNNIFGRDADDDGMAYYSARLEAGESVGSVLASIIGNAATNDAGAFPDSGILANKVEVGLNWAETAALANADIYEEDGATLTAAAKASAQGVIDGVDATDASVEAASAEIDAYFGTAGGIATLTTGTNVETANVFNAPLVTDHGQPGNDTLNSTDVLTGTGENPTLNVALNSSQGTPVAATLNNIETINYQSGFFDSTLDLRNATGVQAINNENSVSNGTVSNITMVEGMTLGVSNFNADAFGVEDQTFIFTEASLAGAEDAVTVNVNDVFMDDLSVSGSGAINGIEIVNLVSTGPDANVLDIVVEGMQTLNITGTADLDLTAADGGATLGDGDLATIDASAFEGDLTATLSDGLEDADVTFTGGAGDDDIYAGTGLTNGDVLDGGAGANVLGLRANASGEFVDSAADGDINVTNFQTLHLDIGNDAGLLGVDSSIDFAAFSDAAAFKTVEVHVQDDAGAPDVDLINAAAGAEFVFLNSEVDHQFGDITLNFVDGAEPDDASISLMNNSVNAAGLVIGDLSVGMDTDVESELEVLNISTAHDAANGATNQVVIDDLITDTVETVNITGDTNLTFTQWVGGNIDKLDASDFTGDLSVGLSFVDVGLVDGATILSGSGDDELWGFTANDTIDGGAGDDWIDGRAGADTLSGGAGDDFIIGGSGIDSIDLGTGFDRVDLQGITSSADRDVVSNFNAGSNGDKVVLNDAQTTLANGDGDEHDGNYTDAVMQVENSVAAAVVFDTANNDIIEFAVDLSGTNMLDNTTLIADLSAGGGIDVALAGDVGYLLAYADGNAYLYHVDSAAVTNDVHLDAGEIQVVGIFHDVAVGSFNAGNFDLV